jgi:hypothetical protein
MIVSVVASDWPTFGKRVSSRPKEIIPMFEFALRKRGRTRWVWRVRNSAGRTIMDGWETSRVEARYKAERALFLLLLASPSIRANQLRPPAQPQRPRARTRLPPF